MEHWQHGELPFAGVDGVASGGFEYWQLGEQPPVWAVEGDGPTIPTEPPDAAPSDLVATAISHQRIDLAWTNNASNATGVAIERSPDESDWAQIDTVGADVESFSNTGLTPETTYYYRVRAFNADGYSDYSNTDSATTDEAPPGPTPPSNLNATAVNHRRVDLTWQDNSDNEKGFKVERKQNEDWDTIAVTNANVEFYSDTGLKPNTPYDYRVSAIGEDDEESEPVEDSATTDPIPDPVERTFDLEDYDMKRISFSLTTDESGDAEQTRSLARPGRLYAIAWDGSDLDVGASVELTSGGVVLWAKDNADDAETFYPRAQEHDADGVELEITTLPVVAESLTLTVANGGNGNTATAQVYVM